MKARTRRQDVANFIVRFFAERGYWPSLREVADGVGLQNPSGAAHVIKQLAKAGILSHHGDGASRGYEVAGLSELLRETAASWIRQRGSYD